MYHHLEGELTVLEPARAVIDAGGVAEDLVEIAVEQAGRELRHGSEPPAARIGLAYDGEVLEQPVVRPVGELVLNLLANLIGDLLGRQCCPTVDVFNVNHGSDRFDRSVVQVAANRVPLAITE